MFRIIISNFQNKSIIKQKNENQIHHRKFKNKIENKTSKSENIQK
jgi:hypothetical protein